jgi:hypothetical protein
VTLQLLRRLILLRKAVSTVHKNKWPLPNISQNNYQLCKKKVYYNFWYMYQTKYFWLPAFWIIHTFSPPHYPRQPGLHYIPEIISGNSNNFYTNNEKTRRANSL